MDYTLYIEDMHTYYHLDLRCCDYVEYLWEKILNKKFDYFTYRLEPEGKILYEKLESDWWHNRLDEYKIVKEPTFKEFLLNKYEDDILKELREVEWENKYRSLSEDELDEILEDNYRYN